MVCLNARFLTQTLTGVQRYALEISRGLRALRKDITLISPKNILDRTLACELGAEEYGKLTGHLWEQLELPAYLRRRAPLLVNFANTAPILYRNQLTSIHDLSFLRNPAWFSRSFSYYYRLLTPLVARRSLRIITVSEFSKREIVSLLRVPEGKIRVIPNGVSRMFSAGSVRRKDSGDYILAISSLDPRKNIRRLIAAYGKLRMLNIKLVLVGEESRIFRNEGLRQSIKSMEGIILHGRVEGQMMIDLYRNARLVVYPSLYEGFGMPPLEAMACGCPVVVSNVSSLPEVCGDAACYVNPYDVDDIAAGMYNALTDEALRGTMIQKGLERARMFSWEKSAREHLKLFEEILT